MLMTSRRIKDMVILIAMILCSHNVMAIENSEEALKEYNEQARKTFYITAIIDLLLLPVLIYASYRIIKMTNCANKRVIMFLVLMNLTLLSFPILC